MTTTQHTGRQGEEAAARWLLDHGFTLLHRNWRQGHYELDIVAARKGTLHFIEVKTRRRDGLTPPEQALDYRKCRALIRAANAYLTENPFEGEMQFDLIAVETAPQAHRRCAISKTPSNSTGNLAVLTIYLIFASAI